MSEYYVAKGIQDVSIIYEKTIAFYKADLVIENNHELIARKLSNDTFAEEFYTFSFYKVPAGEKYFGNYNRNTVNFFKTHSDITNITGYTFTLFKSSGGPFSIISDEDAENIAAFEANDIFPQVGIFDSIKTNLNYISEKIGFGDLFSTVENTATNKSEYIQRSTEEILREQENNFMDALEANQQRLEAFRKNLNKKGACLGTTIEKKSEFYKLYKTYLDRCKIEYSYSRSVKRICKRSILSENYCKLCYYNMNFILLPLENELPLSDRFALVDVANMYIDIFVSMMQKTIAYSTKKKSVSICLNAVMNDSISELTINKLKALTHCVISSRQQDLSLNILLENITKLSSMGVLVNYPELGMAIFEDLLTGYGKFSPEEFNQFLEEMVLRVDLDPLGTLQEKMALINPVEKIILELPEQSQVGISSITAPTGSVPNTAPIGAVPVGAVIGETSRVLTPQDLKAQELLDDFFG